jgi:hypothetical protein
MRKAAALLVTTVLAGVGLVAASPAGAGDKKQSRFCKALSNFDTTGIGSPTTESGAEKITKQLKKIRRAAGGKTKAALGEIIDAYEEVADGESPVEVFANRDFALAAGRFGLAAVKCVGEGLPDITLPDVDLPDITLPDLN